MQYTDKEKFAIVQRHQAGEPTQTLCQEYGISRSTLYRWIKTHCAANASPSCSFSLKDYNILQHRVEKLENMVTILKSVDCTASAPLKDKLNALEPLYGQYDVHTLCQALDVDRGTFYNHIKRNKRDNAWFEKRRVEYRILIQEIFDEHKQIFGADKIRAILIQRGHRVSRKFVTELMQEMGLSSIRTTAKKDYMRLHPVEKKNVLQQQFQADKPNQIWVSDTTYFQLKDKHYYICVIVDLFSRRVVAHKVSQKHSTQLISATFKKAWAERAPASGLIFHSDRGAQYTSNRFLQLLREYGVTQSFSNSGNPHDNAVCESFFSSMKKEELYKKDYPSERAFKQSVDSYIAFYNTKRPHRTLNHLTPCQIEERFAATTLQDKNGT